MAVLALLEAIAADDDARSETAALELSRSDEPALCELGGSDDVDQRWWAVRGLALVGGSECLSTLLRRLNDTDASVRAAAVLALAYVHEREPQAVVPALDAAAYLLADDDGLVRQAAADCLALCGDDAVTALAQTLYASQHQGARTRAASALRKIATLKAAGVLYPLLNDPNHLVRSYAYEALDEMGLLENVLVVP